MKRRSKGNGIDLMRNMPIPIVVIDSWQLFDCVGAFEPYVPHGAQHALRRPPHQLDNLYQALPSPARGVAWAHATRKRLNARAERLWHANA